MCVFAGLANVTLIVDGARVFGFRRRDDGRSVHAEFEQVDAARSRLPDERAAVSIHVKLFPSDCKSVLVIRFACFFKCRTPCQTGMEGNDLKITTKTLSADETGVVFVFILVTHETLIARWISEYRPERKLRFLW